MARWNIEFFMDKLEIFLKANLNTEITQINTDNSDSLLNTIDDSAYVKQFVDDIPNYNPFVGLFVLDPITVESNFEESVYTYNVMVGIYFRAEDAPTDYKKVWRYQQALRHVLEDNFNNVVKGVKFKLSGLTPESFVLKPNAQKQRAVGVSLEVPLT